MELAQCSVSQQVAVLQAQGLLHVLILHFMAHFKRCNRVTLHRMILFFYTVSLGIVNDSFFM